MLAVRLPEELEKRLERLSEKTGRPKSYYAREALTEYIDDLEDHYLSEARLKQFGSGPGIPLETLMKKYGLAD
jgi:RHH-type rel operon transcriptional repressor/antitoxin RelB